MEVKTTTKQSFILKGPYLADLHDTSARQGKGAVMVIEMHGLRITARIERM